MVAWHKPPLFPKHRFGDSAHPAEHLLKSPKMKHQHTQSRQSCHIICQTCASLLPHHVFAPYQCLFSNKRASLPTAASVLAASPITPPTTLAALHQLVFCKLLKHCYCSIESFEAECCCGACRTTSATSACPRRLTHHTPTHSKVTQPMLRLHV